MGCRETQTLLTAFHDGELPVDGRARVEEHLRVCPECRALLADLARADQSAGVPDPGSAYWDGFNARVMDRVEREADGHGRPSAEAGRDATGSNASADGPGVAVLRPKHGWMRQQLRYLVPAAAAAALVVVVVRYGGMHPVAPTTAMDGLVPGQAGRPRVLSPRPAIPPAVSEPGASESAGERAVVRRVPDESSRGGGTPAAPSPPIPDERNATDVREERDRVADRSIFEAKEKMSRDRAAAPAVIGVPTPVPQMTFRGAPDGQGRSSAGTGRDAPGSVVPAGSPCARARTLAAQERWREAEAAQRACLAGDLDEPSREKGLVFLAELLDRQARFAEADAVITEVDWRFPQSRPLDLYRQQRPMVQKQPAAVPVTR